MSKKLHTTKLRRPRTIEDVFTERTRAAFNNMLSRDPLLTRISLLTLGEFRAFILESLNNRARCPYCSRLLNASTFSVDHITPLARGGQHEISNLELVCAFCNKAKGDFDRNVFLDLLTAAETSGRANGQLGARWRLIERLGQGLGHTYSYRQRKAKS